MRRNSDFTKLVQKSLNKQTTTTTKTTTINLGEVGESYLLSAPIVIFKILSLQKKLRDKQKQEKGYKASQSITTQTHSKIKTMTKCKNLLGADNAEETSY